MKSGIALFFTAALLLACDRDAPGGGPPHTESGAEASSVEDGVTFREGKGLEVSDATRKILNIRLAQVTEGKLSVPVTGTGRVYRRSGPPEFAPVASREPVAVAELSLLLSEKEAEGVTVGSPVDVGDPKRPGTVRDVRPPRRGLAADAEVLIDVPDPQEAYPVGSAVAVVIQGPAPESAAIIPRQALLETVSGTFVYVPNGRYYFRTAVTVGRKTKESAEITDGLYPGDEVVTEPVTSLWLAELQSLRGGVACADGH